MRFAGALLLALPLLGVARSRSAQLKKRERLLRELAAFFGRMGALAGRRRKPLPELLSQLKEEFPGLGFLPEVLCSLRDGGEFSAAWQSAAGAHAPGLLRGEEAELLRSFPAAALGPTAAGFESACGEAAAAFAGYAAAAGAERIRQTRLWMGLGAFGALLTVIVLA